MITTKKYLYSDHFITLCKQTVRLVFFIRVTLQIMVFENYFVPVPVKQSEKQLVADFLADQPIIDEGSQIELLIIYISKSPPRISNYWIMKKVMHTRSSHSWKTISWSTDHSWKSPSFWRMISNNNLAIFSTVFISHLLPGSTFFSGRSTDSVISGEPLFSLSLLNLTFFSKIQFPSINTRYNENYLITKESEKNVLLDEFHTIDYEQIIQKHQVGRRLNTSSSISVTRAYAARVWVNRWIYKAIAPWFQNNKSEWKFYLFWLNCCSSLVCVQDFDRISLCVFVDGVM